MDKMKSGLRRLERLGIYRSMRIHHYSTTSYDKTTADRKDRAHAVNAFRLACSREVCQMRFDQPMDCHCPCVKQPQSMASMHSLIHSAAITRRTVKQIHVEVVDSIRQSIT